MCERLSMHPRETRKGCEVSTHQKEGRRGRKENSQKEEEVCHQRGLVQPGERRRRMQNYGDSHFSTRLFRFSVLAVHLELVEEGSKKCVSNGEGSRGFWRRKERALGDWFYESDHLITLVVGSAVPPRGGLRVCSKRVEDEGTCCLTSKKEARRRDVPPVSLEASL